MGRRIAVVIALFSALSGCETSSTWTVRRLIGAAGGVFEFRDVTLTVPAGALAQDVELAISAEQEPAGVPARSALYRFAPPALELASPATLALPFRGAGSAQIAVREGDDAPFYATRTTAISSYASVEATRFSQAVVVDETWFPTAPVMARAAGTYENDFVATPAMHADGETYCFTVDGPFPTCAANGTCGSGAVLSSEGIPITDAAPEKVLRVIACAPSRMSEPRVFTYSLKVGSVDPTPFPGTYPAPLTITFLSGTSGATIRYSTLNARITCDSGMVVPGDGITLNETTRIQFIGCKAGYLPSVVNQPTDPYTISP